jgi:hypothetical protein
MKKPNIFAQLAFIAFALFAIIFMPIFGFEMGKQSNILLIVLLTSFFSGIIVYLWRAINKSLVIHKVALVRIIVLVFLFTFGAIFGVDNPKFRFENYGSGNEAKEALLKLYPRGSNIYLLIETLSKSGAWCRDSMYVNSEIIYCTYTEKEVIFSTDWEVTIQYTEYDDKKSTKKLSLLDVNAKNSIYNLP